MDRADIMAAMGELKLYGMRAAWGLMPESAESYAKAVWSSFGPPVFTGEKDVRPPEG